MDPTKPAGPEPATPAPSTGEPQTPAPAAPPAPEPAPASPAAPSPEPSKTASELEQQILGTPPAEPAPQPGAQPPAAPEPQTPPAPGEPQPPSRADRRAQRLATRLRAGVTAPPAAPAAPSQPTPSTPYKPLELEPDQQYSVEQLRADREQYADARFQEGIKAASTVARQEAFVDRLEIDGDRVASKYPVLDEDSDQFNAELASNINEMYLSTVGYDQRTGQVRNPNVRYKDYVDAFMVSVDKLAEARNAGTAQNVAAQVAATGVRPTGVAPSSASSINDPSDIHKLSDAEWARQRPALDAEIARALNL